MTLYVVSDPVNTWLRNRYVPSLPQNVKAWLREDYDRTLEQNYTILTQRIDRERCVAKSVGQERVFPADKSITPFQLSTRLEGYIKELAGGEVQFFNIADNVTALLNCEYFILQLNHGEPLKYNPFLYHWIEAAAQIQYGVLCNGELPVTYANMARLEIIRLAFTSLGAEKDLNEPVRAITMNISPRGMMDSAKAQFRSLRPIDLRPAMDMLRAQDFPLATKLEQHYPRLQHVPQEASVDSSPWILPVTESTLALDSQPPIVLESQPPEKPLDDKSSIIEPADNVSYSPTLSAGGGFASATGSERTESKHQSLSPQDKVPNKNMRSEHDIDSRGSPAIEGNTPARAGELGMSYRIFSKVTARSSLQEVRDAFLIEPEDTTRFLTRLNLDLASLEFFTKLLESGTLMTAGADTTAITREYVQHCLRVIERVGDTFASDSDVDDDTPDNNLPVGREEQIRSVKLLVLFMTNLLRKGLLPVQELAFDLQGVCIRFIWIPEVRQFRKLLEGSDVIEATAFTYGVGG